MKKKPNVKLKTITFYIKDSKNEKIFNIMTNCSKNIYNFILFIYNIYKCYQTDLYKSLYKWLTDKKLNKSEYKKMTNESHQYLYSSFGQYLKSYIKDKELKKTNNQIIYKYICENMNKDHISNDTFRDIINAYILETKDLVKYTDENKYMVHEKIVEDIFISIYYKIYYTTTDELKNNKTITATTNKTFIEQIKNGNIVDELQKKNSYIEKITKKFKIIMCTEINIIGRLVYKYMNKQLHDSLPSDLICNLIKKFYENIKSYYGLRSKGIKANKPTFKQINEKCNLFYYEGTYKIINDATIRLTVGQNISKEYKYIISGKYGEDNENIIYITNRTYTYKTYLKNTIKKEDKNKYIKINDKYVHKDNVYDNNYMYINIPKKIRKDKIRYIEIIPIYDGHKYKINIAYKDEQQYKETEEIEKIKIEDSISIDLGVKNLMTIYDPTGEQKIIKGKIINSKNNYYNKKIDEQQSKKNKEKMRELLIKREQEINQYIVEMINVLTEKYKNKKLVIIGYNKNWKNKVNIGRKNNRTFMNIPYKRIMNKLESKLKEKGITMKLVKESYTSKCDAQSLEEICMKEEYKGERKKRGLYVSKETKKAINADLNGAINIMRKYYKTEYKEIKGEKIYNPTELKIIGKSEKITNNRL